MQLPTRGEEDGFTCCRRTFFIAIHFVISGSPLRGKIVAATGEGPFRGIFSLLSLLAIAWLSRAYAQGDYVHIWGKLYGFRPYALFLMLLAFVLVVLALASPNPTAVGGEALLAQEQPAKGIQRVTRHPFLWGVALWALTHLILNGDLASLVFFGSLFIVAVAGPFSIDRKQRNAVGEAWDRYTAVTSNLPFLAIAQGRNSLKIGEIGWWPPAIAVIIYGLMLHFHRILFGVSPLPL